MNHAADQPDARQRALVASRLLCRGGRTLGMAAAALTAGQGPSEKWHALPAETLAAVEEVLRLLCACDDDEAIELALTRALSPLPTAAPAWAQALAERPSALCEIAERVELPLVSSAFGEGRGPANELEHGLAALAVALCRSPDALAALASTLPEAVGARLARFGRLAHAQAEPGIPSRVRALLRREAGRSKDQDG